MFIYWIIIKIINKIWNKFLFKICTPNLHKIWLWRFVFYYRSALLDIRSVEYKVALFLSPQAALIKYCFEWAKLLYHLHICIILYKKWFQPSTALYIYFHANCFLFVTYMRLLMVLLMEVISRISNLIWFWSALRNWKENVYLTL